MNIDFCPWMSKFSFKFNISKETSTTLRNLEFLYRKRFIDLQ
ncbi:hypothetical protein GXM_09187 [Nostoc sphaeroides CCNUC1]|uniref:Uncharacterized protein n=1 Tax=Nostoc sphaeroides CCNUC1 TaxID=2653204 RepID=A0A5P8WFS2_9NOSO|nr:hypothetical protein GXM_09187 [Nostoc sphaeroides CCNUC1]